MQAVVGNDAFHAPNADLPSALTQLLRDHLRRGIAVEKTMPDHLANRFRRSPIIGLRPALPTLQCRRPSFAVSSTQLKIALLAVAELASRLKRSRFFALALDEHEQLASDFVALGHVQEPARPDNRMTARIELRHDRLLRLRGTLPGCNQPGRSCFILPEETREVQ